MQPRQKPPQVSKPRTNPKKPITLADLRAIARVQTRTKLVLNLLIFIWLDVLLLVTIWAGLAWAVMLVLKQGKVIWS